MLTNKKTEGQKSRDTIPLKGVFHFSAIQGAFSFKNAKSPTKTSNNLLEKHFLWG
jgi:hypothetical protein